MQPYTVSPYREKVERSFMQFQGSRSWSGPGFSLLDFLKNKVNAGIEIAERARKFEESHVIRRHRIGGGVDVIPLRVMSRSWYTWNGRRNNAIVLYRRGDALITLAAESPERFKLITLTFADVYDSWNSQGELRRFLRLMRQWAVRRGAKVSYMWIADVQKRLAVHYHIAVSGLPYVDKKVIDRWWGKGFIDVRAVEPEHGVRYVLKYVKSITTAIQDAGERMLGNVMFAGARSRRMGSSRDVSKDTKPDGLVPRWVLEVVDMVLGDKDQVETGVGYGVSFDGKMGEVIIDGENVIVDLTQQKWFCVAGWMLDYSEDDEEESEL